MHKRSNFSILSPILVIFWGFFFFFKDFLMFTHFGRECALKQGRGSGKERERDQDRDRDRERERERETDPSRFHTVSTEPDVGFELKNCEIMTWAEIKSQTLHRLSHSGAPRGLVFLFVTLDVFLINSHPNGYEVKFHCGFSMSSWITTP